MSKRKGPGPLTRAILENNRTISAERLKNHTREKEAAKIAAHSKESARDKITRT